VNVVLQADASSRYVAAFARRSEFLAGVDDVEAAEKKKKEAQAFAAALDVY
jgi:hypothetical protein